MICYDVYRHDRSGYVWLARFRYSGDAIGYCHTRGLDTKGIIEVKIESEPTLETNRHENLNNG